MKILLVNKFFYQKGGSETYFFTLAEALKKHGHEVVFFAMQDEKNLPSGQSRFFVKRKDYNRGSFFTQFKDGLQLLYSHEAKKKMEQLLETEKPDLAVLNLVHRQLTLSILEPLKKCNIPVFFVMHDWVCVCPNCTMISGGRVCEKCLGGHFLNCVKQKCVKASAAKSLLAAMEAYFYRWRRTYDKVDLYVAPSVFLQKKLQAGNFTRAPILHLRNPLPENTIYRMPEHVKNHLLYFGRLSPEKGILTLLKAMHELPDTIELRIAGDGPQRGELEQFVNDNRLEDRVSFLGFQTGKALQTLVEQSRCVVLPSEWYENCPYAVMEAMAKGKPCIVSNQGGLPELVDNGRSGYVFEARNAVSLCSAVRKIFSLSEERYSAMCFYAMQKAEHEFSPDRYLEQIFSEYRAIKKRQEKKSNE